MKKVKLTKISDDVFNGKHPDGIFEGYVKEGLESRPPAIGERYYVQGRSISSIFITSPVTVLPDENGVFKTTYSTYKLEYLNE